MNKILFGEMHHLMCRYFNSSFINKTNTNKAISICISDSNYHLPIKGRSPATDNSLRVYEFH